MRRFCARPSSVSFPAIGWLSARPSTVRRVGSCSRCSITALAACARATESWKFDGNCTVWIGRLSVCPVTSTAPGSSFSASPMRSSSDKKSGRTAALPKANMPRLKMRTSIICGVSDTVTRCASISGCRKRCRLCTTREGSGAGAGGGRGGGMDGGGGRSSRGICAGGIVAACASTWSEAAFSRVDSTTQHTATVATATAAITQTGTTARAGRYGAATPFQCGDSPCS